MFKLFGKKDEALKLYKPAAGKVIDIAQVPDAMFSQKLMGEGIAIEPEGDTVVAPCDGEILLVAKTLHAVALQTSNGVEVLIHVGLDTVELKGQGFTSHVSAGDKVKKGDKLLSFDRQYITEQGKPLVTPVVITNADEKVADVEKFFGENDVIMAIKVK